MPSIVALVVANPNQAAGGAPIFIVGKEEEQQQVALSLEKILDATAHDLKNGTILLVQHSSQPS